jgi:uncharacterized MAPEG superfamily protein
MSVELTMLAYSAGLLLVLAAIQGTAGVLAKGLVPMAGNRDEVPAATGWHARSLRAVDNLRENLTIFTPLVLAAAVAGVANEWTALGAQLFFYGRVAHAALYLIGVPWLRTLAWLAGVIGTAMIFCALMGWI